MFIVRVLIDGLADDTEFAYENTALAYFSSTIDRYRRTDSDVDVAVQFLIDGELEYEKAIPRTD